MPRHVTVLHVHRRFGRLWVRMPASHSIDAGNLYGTAGDDNFIDGYGMVYKLTHVDSNWIYSPIHQFRGQPEQKATGVARHLRSGRRSLREPRMREAAT